MKENRTGSPCIRVCILDSQSKLCSGCFRTSEEIGKWLSFTEEERSQVLSKLKERRYQYEQRYEKDNSRIVVAKCSNLGMDVE
jgi:uncharacterized protein